MASDSKDGRLTTHVLDTASGRPAAGLTIGLFAGHGADALLIAETTTNDDGRCDGPLLSGSDLAPGHYEIRFHVGDYFNRATPDVAPFYDVVPVPFIVEDAGAHYHVPLLIAPFGYSTYRGS